MSKKLRITYRPNRKWPHDWSVDTPHGQFIVKIDGVQGPLSEPLQRLIACGGHERNKGKRYQLTDKIPNAEFMRLFRTGVDIVMPNDPVDQNIVHAIIEILATQEGAIEILPSS